ncbi:HET-domain-containing protein, partial [Hypoxylon sp. EC38]
MTPTPRYVTLSHCWGKSQHMKLQTQNYSILQKRQPNSILPKTYRDAFRVALSLGIRFIWIDSLCIIQNDEADWRSQSPLMGSIYHNSYCNIAATWGADGDDGCFSNRVPYTKCQARIALNTPGGRLVEHDILDVHSYSRDITEAQLNTRGWVIQERCLARRQLSFARDQVYWECSDLSASEQFPSGILGPMLKTKVSLQHIWSRVKPELDFSSELRLRESWTMLVELYSSCDFTIPSDRLFALVGLASSVQQTTSDEYIAGLWKRDIQKQLCWQYEGRGERCQDTDTLVPTWSWLKMNGKV